MQEERRLECHGQPSQYVLFDRAWYARSFIMSNSSYIMLVSKGISWSLRGLTVVAPSRPMS